MNVDDDPVADDGPPVEEPADDQTRADEIPLAVLAAMKDRMHARRLSPVDDNNHVQESLGTADDDVYVIDDGPEHCMIGRPVGCAPDGSIYVLVARISRYGYEQLRDGDVEMSLAFSDGRDVSLCAVYEVDGIVENIALVRRYRHGDDVPAAYLPPSVFIEFADEDSPTDDPVADDPGADDPGAGEYGAGGYGADESGADQSGADASEDDEDAPKGEPLLIDEDALIDERGSGGFMRRALASVTGTSRRRQQRAKT